MNSEIQQKKLDYIAEKLNNSVKNYSYCFMIVGSYAHSRGFAIKNTTDIDAMILCDNHSIEKILTTECYKGYSVNIIEAINHLERGDTQLISTRHTFNDCLFTVHFMTPDIFATLFANPLEKKLFSFRKVKKEYTYEFKNFNGDGIKIKVENYPVNDGFLVPMETCVFRNGRYFSGSPHNKLLSSPKIYFDKTERVDNAILELKKALILTMREEYGDCVNRGNVSLINTLVRKNEIHPTITERLATEEYMLLRQIR